MAIVIPVLVLLLVAMSITSPIEESSDVNDKNYCKNLLPGEDLLSEFGAKLSVMKYDVLFYHNNDDDKVSADVIENCDYYGGIDELKLEKDGLNLYCVNDDHVKHIARIETPRDLSSFEYYRLTIKYKKPEMEKPNLMIINTKNSEAIWGYYPIRFLSSLKQVNKIKTDNYGRIYEDNTLSIFDKMRSTEGDENYIYLSLEDGLKLKDKNVNGIYNMKIENNNFLINDKIIIKNKNKLELTYNGISNKLIMNNKTHENIWELYGSKKCDKIISTNKNCNTFYTYNQINITDTNEVFKFIDNTLEYSKGPNNKKLNKFNISKYTGITEPLFSINLNSDGSIGLNNNQYFIHKEYFVTDKYYKLESIGGNLILSSSTGEFKWALNKYISNREYDTDIINIDDSFSENEMIYCGDYSVIILGGQLLYRDHKAKTSTVIKFSRTDNYLTSISVNADSIVFYGEESVGRIFEKISPYGRNFNSSLRCEKRNRGIVWDNGDGKILWSYPELKQATTTTTTTTTTTKQKTTRTVIAHTHSTVKKLSTPTIVMETKTTTVPYATTIHVTKSKTYYSYSFQGTVPDGSFFYIGVNNLSTTNKIKLQSSKFKNWLFESTSNPSKMYLANASNALTNMCLSVSNQKKSDSLYYMNIVNCKNTNYKFKFNTSNTNSRDETKYANLLIIYNNNSVYKINGQPMCVYYDTYLYAYPCSDPKKNDTSLGWKRITNSNYIKKNKENVATTSYSVVKTTYPRTTSRTYYTTIYNVSYETLVVVVNDNITPAPTPAPTPSPKITKTMTTTTTSIPTALVSLDGKCGPNNNNQVCSDNECCSKYGYCGGSDAHCLIANGCQSEFGRCNTSTSATVTISLDGKCGPNNNNQVCSNNECCSKYGYCGGSDEHCLIANGCQSEFGRCNTSPTIPTINVSSTPTSLDGKCGPKYNNQVCSDNECCSKHGYCGRSDDHCLTVNGCQSEFGRCN